jgi:hypothetical protein
VKRFCPDEYGDNPQTKLWQIWVAPRLVRRSIMMRVYMDRATCVAGLAFFVAFALTCWPHRRTTACAAILYVIGGLTSLGSIAYGYLESIALGWGMGDGPPVSFPRSAFLLPTGILCYAVAASVLLLPFISQHRALYFGKLLHVIVFPLLILFLFVGPFYEFQRVNARSLAWLVYGLLWFRIRESYFAGRPPMGLPVSKVELTST